ncbi:hypothetical protein [Paenarthrobacter sp. YIM B13468]|jgi:hypothetical protein|uniref:hypothetical protein n=1 Tax=Paenarthrobacter sp. YIM B13468 TaxID=3366295 RepID=UPI0036733CE5
MKDPRPKLFSMLASVAESVSSSLDEYTRKNEAVKALGILPSDEPDAVTRKLALAVVELQQEVAELRKEVENKGISS